MKQSQNVASIIRQKLYNLRVIESTRPSPQPLPTSPNSNMDTKRFNKTYKKIRHIYSDMVILK